MKFPVASAIWRAASVGRSTSKDHLWSSGRPRLGHSLVIGAISFSQKFSMVFTELHERQQTIGQRSATRLFLLINSPQMSSSRQKSTATSESHNVDPESPCWNHLLSSASRKGLRFYVPSVCLATMLLMMLAQDFVHTAPGHGREDFDIWMANDISAGSGRESIRQFLTPSMKTALSLRPRPGSPASASSTTRARRATPTRR